MSRVTEPSRTGRLVAGALRALERCGVREVVFCGGARNAALAEPLLATGWPVMAHFDERGAAFFALGRARSLEAAVAVVVTSGTAVAECLPAVIEAFYQGLPLVIVSADRPKRFRGSGAPQAIEQAGLFGVYCPVAIDAEDAAEESWAELELWDGASPWQLNLCFEEEDGLVPEGGKSEGVWDEGEVVKAVVAGDGDDLEVIEGEEDMALAAARLGEWVNPCGDGELLVLVGDLLGSDRPAVLDFLHRLQAPFWAEASSGMREEPGLQPFRLEGGEGALAGGSWRRVLRLGGVPSCRFWRDLEVLFRELPVLSVNRTGHGGLGRGGEVLRARLAELLPVCGVRRQGRAVATLRRDREAAAELEKRLLRESGTELARLRVLAEGIPNGSLVFVGNSLPVREWNLVAPRLRRQWETHASRGANGIDGQIATFLGLAQGLSVESGREAWGILGDLTTLYDINSLTLAQKLEARLPLRLVVMNNGGGAIFRQLPALAELPSARDMVINAHQESLLPWARAAGWKTVSWAAGEALPERLPTRVVIEIVC